MRELGPFLAGIADTKFEEGFDGEPTTLRFPTPGLATIKMSGKSGHFYVRATAREGIGYTRQNDALILSGPPHVVVCIVSKLKYVWWEGLLVVGYAAMLGGVLVKNRVGVG